MSGVEDLVILGLCFQKYGDMSAVQCNAFLGNLGLRFDRVGLCPSTVIVLQPFGFLGCDLFTFFWRQPHLASYTPRKYG